MQKTLTIFTPVYNRAHTIGRTYESLLCQTCKDFEWLVIDDGSTDNTKTLIEGWIKENRIPIRYIYQENQGMHGAHNTAYLNITTELNTCIDSDDWMPDDAVERILKLWKEKGARSYAGIIGLDANKEGKILGSAFPEGMNQTTLRDYYEQQGGSGDKKLVYRTEVIRGYPDYPLFEGERYVGLAYKYNMIDENYQMLTDNSVYVIVDYQDDGSSRGMWKQYWNNPKGFAFLRKFDMCHTKSLRRRLMDNIHYVSHSIRSRNRKFMSESPKKFLTFVSLIPGTLLYFYNRHQVLSGSLFKSV